MNTKTTKTKTTKTNKTCKGAKAATCPVLAERASLSEVKEDIAQFISRIPGWLQWARQELKTLIARLEKLDAFLDRVIGAPGEDGEYTAEALSDMKGDPALPAIKAMVAQRKATRRYISSLESLVGQVKAAKAANTEE